MNRNRALLMYALIIVLVAIPLSTLFARPREQTTGLVAAYAFEEADGGSILDTSGNNHNGTLLGGAKHSELGVFGNALLLRGGNYSDSVTIPDSSSLDLSNTMTIEAWVYPTMQQDWQTVILKESEVGLRYGLYANSDTNTPVAATEVSGYGYIETRNSYPLPHHKWTYLAATYDATTLTLYINGYLVSSTMHSGGIDTSSEPLRIGGNDIWGEYFAGLIDNIRIYNRALSIAEIKTDMHTPIGGSIVTPTPTLPPYPVPSQSQPQLQSNGFQEPYAYLPLIMGNARTPADAYYVLPNWDEPVTYQGITGSRAYVEGFFANINTPIFDGSEPMTQLILALGAGRSCMGQSH